MKMPGKRRKMAGGKRTEGGEYLFRSVVVFTAGGRTPRGQIDTGPAAGGNGAGRGAERFLSARMAGASPKYQCCTSVPRGCRVRPAGSSLYSA